MPYVCFRNILDEKEDFVEIEGRTLVKVAHEYAKLQDDDVYTAIMHEGVKVFLNNEEFLVSEWSRELKKDDKIVIVPKPGGPALMIFGGAALMGGAAIGVQIGLLTAGSFLTTMIFATGLSMVLGGISQLLFAPDLPAPASIRGGRETQTYNWSGIKTMAKTDTPITIVYGTHMVGGNIVSLYTDSYNNTNYLYMLLALCEGEIEGICQERNFNASCHTSNTATSLYEDPAIYVDDQPLREFENVEWWYRKGTNLPDSSKDEFNPRVQNKIPNFDGARIQHDDGREIDTDGVVYTTTKPVDMAVVQIQSPALYKVVNGQIVQNTVKYKIYWKPIGGSYSTFTADKFEPSVSGGTDTNANYCTCTRYSSGTYLWGYKAPTRKIQIIENNYSPFSPSGSTYAGWTSAYHYWNIKFNILDSNNNILETRTINGWENYSYIPRSFFAPALYPDGPHVYLNSSHNPTFRVDSYVVQLDPHGVQPGNEFTISSSKTASVEEIEMKATTKTGFWQTITLDFNDLSTGKDTYVIKVVRTDGGTSSSIEEENKAILHSVTEVIQGNFIYPNTALLGLKIKASQQLSGAPPNIKTVVMGKRIEVPNIRDTSGAENAGNPMKFDSIWWDNTNSKWIASDNATVFWNDTSSYRTEYSENSMLCVRDLMLNALHGLGEYVEEVDLNSAAIRDVVKECHKTYDPYPSSDYFSWWNGGSDDYWSDRWDITILNEYTNASSNEASRYVKFKSTQFPPDREEQHNYIRFKLDTPIKKGETYTASINLSNVGSEIYRITWYAQETVPFGEGRGQSHYIGLSSYVSTSGGTVSQTFKTNYNSNAISLHFKSKKLFSAQINNVSMTRRSNEHYHTFNGVLESGQSALTALLEMCDSFRCWPIWKNGKFTFVSDTDDTPIHTITIGNDISFSQTFTPLSEIPYRLIGQITDEEDFFNMKSLVAVSDKVDLTKSNEKTVGLKGITNIHKAQRELRWKLKKITNCTHVVNIRCGLDMIHATAGDIIYVQDNLPSWGKGGRILSYTATNVTLEATYGFTNVATDTHLLRFSDDENNYYTATIDHTNISNGDSLRVIPIENLPASPCEDSPYAIGESSNYLKKFRLISTNRTNEEEVEVIGMEHLSSLYSEPTLDVIEVQSNPYFNPMAKPGVPRDIRISQLSVYEGIGFAISAKPQFDDKVTKEIVVQIDEEGNGNFTTIAIMPLEQVEYKYKSDNLQLEETYTFRLFCRSAYRDGDPIEVESKLSKDAYAIPAPTGLSIKDSNSASFDTKDVTIVWNPVGVSTGLVGTIKGYKIEVYHTDPTDTSNILRTDFAKNEIYTYTLEMNEEDCSRNSTEQARYSTLYFKVYAVSEAMIVSQASKPFKISNDSPDTLTGLTGKAILGGSQFRWNKSNELDHKLYKYKTKVSSDSWSSWTNIAENSVNRILTATEIDSHGAITNIKFAVKDMDFYHQESSVASVNASSNNISDNIYRIISSKSGGISGSTASLLDGNYSSGGVVIS